MAGIQRHGDDCMMLFGKRFNHVHKWLDQYAKIYDVNEFLDYHRTFLHNSYGIEFIKRKWGSKAEKAAKIHIYRDFCGTPIKQWKLKEILAGADRAIMYFNNFKQMNIRFPKKIREY